jgi:hypothetical protein
MIDQSAEKGIQSAKEELGLAYKWLTETPAPVMLHELQHVMAGAVKASLLDPTVSGVIPWLHLDDKNSPPAEVAPLSTHTR